MHQFSLFVHVNDFLLHLRSLLRLLQSFLDPALLTTERGQLVRMFFVFLSSVSLVYL